MGKISTKKTLTTLAVMVLMMGVVSMGPSVANEHMETAKHKVKNIAKKAKRAVADAHEGGRRLVRDARGKEKILDNRATDKVKDAAKHAKRKAEDMKDDATHKMKKAGHRMKKMAE